MNNMNCVSTMPEIMPEITDEAIIEALFAQRPYEEKVINSAYLEIPAEYQRKLNIPNVEKMSAEFSELIANPPKVSYRDGHYYVFDGQHTIVTRRAMNGGKTFELITNGFTEKSGMRVLNAFPLGFRHFYTKKPVATIDDMKHLRMRVPNIPLYINFAKECGISGQPMPFAEVTGALDQGVIDGGDSPLSDIVSIKMYETTPEITLTGHLLVIHSLYINEKFYQSLPEQDKKWIDEAAKRSADYVWDLVEKVDADAVKTITEAGGHVSEPSPELHKFMQDAGKRSWKLFYDTVPNAKEILDSADSYRQAK